MVQKAVDGFKLLAKVENSCLLGLKLKKQKVKRYSVEIFECTFS